MKTKASCTNKLKQLTSRLNNPDDDYSKYITSYEIKYMKIINIYIRNAHKNLKKIKYI